MAVASEKRGPQTPQSGMKWEAMPPELSTWGITETPNGLELSCPAARATACPLSRILAGKTRLHFRALAGSAAASC
jgi:hypothetical protein